VFQAQIGLPPQTELVHTLRLSSIERHFYAKQEAALRRVVGAAMRQRTAGGAAEAALERIAGPLLRLRYSAIHVFLNIHIYMYLPSLCLSIYL